MFWEMSALRPHPDMPSSSLLTRSGHLLLRKGKRPDQSRLRQHGALCQSTRLQRYSLFKIAFIQTKRRPPDSRINSYLVGKSAQAAISMAITLLCSVAHQKAPRSVELPDSTSLALAEPAA